MTLSNILLTLFEISFGGLIIWGFWHEEKVIKFEDKILAKLGFKINRKHSAKITQFKPGRSQRKNCI